VKGARRTTSACGARALRASILIAGLMGMASGVGAQQAAGQATAPVKTGQCVTCHGALGLSNIPDAPHLAGQSQIYLTAQLKAYRSGARKHAVMNVIAGPLSDEDIAEVVGWYSSIRIEAHAP
jgi:cytochrome c553